MDDITFRNRMNRLKIACHGEEIAVDLGLRGRGKRFFCPGCQPAGGKTPDLSVFDQGFKCYKCGLTGDVIDLVVLAGRMSKADAIAYLERKTGIDRQKGPGHDKGRKEIVAPGASWKAGSADIQRLRADINAITAKDDKSDLYDAFLKTVCVPIQGTRGGAYLEKRGIDAEVADRYGVRYCPDVSGLWTLAEKKQIRDTGLSSLYVFQKARLPFLVFPYIRRGRPVMIKARCLLPKDEADRLEVPRFLNTGGIVPSLWNHDAIQEADRVVVCEGEIDALSAIMAGFVGVGLPGWSHWKDAWTMDFKGKDVILVMDADLAGEKGSIDIARRFMKAGLRCPLQLVMEEGKDLNDLIQEFMNA